MKFIPFTHETLNTPQGVAQLNEYLGQVLTLVPSKMKSGTTQTTAGASAGELWLDTDDNTVKVGT